MHVTGMLAGQHDAEVAMLTYTFAAPATEGEVCKVFTQFIWCWAVRPPPVHVEVIWSGPGLGCPASYHAVPLLKTPCCLVQETHEVGMQSAHQSRLFGQHPDSSGP